MAIAMRIIQEKKCFWNILKVQCETNYFTWFQNTYAQKHHKSHIESL